MVARRTHPRRLAAMEVSHRNSCTRELLAAKEYRKRSASFQLATVPTSLRLVVSLFSLPEIRVHSHLFAVELLRFLRSLLLIPFLGPHLLPSLCSLCSFVANLFLCSLCSFVANLYACSLPPSAPSPSKSIKISLGSAPLPGPTIPRFSNSSMIRAARP